MPDFDPAALSAPAPAPIAPPGPPAGGSAEIPKGVPGAPHPGVMTPMNGLPAPGADEASQIAQQTAATVAQAQAQADAAAQAAGAPAGPPAGSARALAAQMGLPAAGQFADDGSFLQAVLEQAGAAATYQTQLQSVLAQQQQLQQTIQLMQAQAAAGYAQSGAAAAPAPAPPKKGFWSPPEYQPVWESMIRRDEAGNIAVVPGADPSILPRYLAYHGYRRDFAEKFLSNPEATLAPMIAAQAEERARELVKSEMEAAQSRSYVEGFIATNSAWLHAHDQAGNVITNPATGQGILSPAGQRFHAHLKQAEAIGIRDIRQQESYARNMLRHDVAMEQYQAGAGEAAANAQTMAANRRPNQAGLLPRHGAASPVPAGLSLRDQLVLAFRENGITDETITY